MDDLERLLDLPPSEDPGKRLSRAKELKRLVAQIDIEDAYSLPLLFSGWFDRLLAEWDGGRECGSPLVVLDLMYLRLVARQGAQKSVAWHTLSLQLEAALEARIGELAAKWWPWLRECWQGSQPRKTPRLQRCLVCGSLYAATDLPSNGCPQPTCLALT